MPTSAHANLPARAAAVIPASLMGHPGPSTAPELIVRANLAEARSALSKVVEMAAKHGHRTMQISARIRRMLASALLEDHQAARTDADEAVRLAPDNAKVLVAAGRAALDRQDNETAVNVLRQAVMRGGANEARFFLSVALWNRNASGDRNEATGLLCELAKEDGSRVELTVDLAVEGLLGTGRTVEAGGLLDSVDGIEACLEATLRARVAAVASDDARMRACADAAVAAVSATTRYGTLTKLSKVLMAQGRFGEALSILQKIARPGFDEDVGRRLVECAARLERHDIVLRYCAEARAADVYDDFLIWREVRLLDRYDPPKAIELLGDVLARDPSNHSARVHLVVLAHRLARADLIRQHIALLPTVTEVEATEGAAVVGILREHGTPRDALAYAYELLRLHFRDHHAHRAFRDACLWTDPKEKEEPTPEAVAAGVAVRLDEDGGPSRWHVLEDSQLVAPPIDDELRVDDAFARRLMGKRVGDDVVLEGPGVQRKARVAEIVPKRVYRLRDVLDRWQFRFPDHNELWMLRVENEGGDADFKEVMRALEYRREQTENAAKLYKEHPLSIGIFAQLLGSSELTAVGHVAGQDDLRLRCCRGSRDEQQEALSAFATASEIVVDLSALATLIMAEDFEALEATGKKILLPHSSMGVLRALAAEMTGRRKPEGSMESTPSGPRILVPTEEVRDGAAAFVARLLAWFEAHAGQTSTTELAALAPETRRELENVLGQHALDAAIVATGPNRILWTDDAVAATVISHRLGVRRIWTQSAFEWLVREGRIDADRHARLSARLIGWGYDFTSANERIDRMAGTLAEWDSSKRPLRQVIAYLSLREVAPRDALQLAAFLTRDAYRHAALSERRRTVFLSVLDALRTRTDLKERAFDELAAALPRIFGLDVLGCDDAMKTLDAWRVGKFNIVRP